MADELTPEESIHKTRIAGLNFSDKKPVRNEEVIIAGYLQSYNKKEKKWDPVENKNLKILIDEEKVGESKTDHNGYFSFKHIFTALGDHTVEVVFERTQRFAQAGATSSLSVITEKQKRNVERIAKIVLAFIGLIIIIAVLALYLAKG